ncbi:MAG: FxsA family protein [Pseudohongiella sp.]|nr:FxsA family protein [Pseudohongiella sp.]MDO9520914.1 FxsA family protein [Pseudohongiella sp.]MDP2128023.1 FxsA family protein [Pseudohongiella sp.]
MRLPLLGFLILPVVELYLLFALAAEIGGFNTLLVVIVTAIAGVTIMRRQGMNSMSRMTQRMQLGQSPAPDLLNGMLLGFAGFMLILPGLMTDTIGVLLLIPVLRHRMARRMIGGAMGSSVFMGGFTRTRSSVDPRSTQGDIIDGEVVDRDQPRQGEPLFPGHDKDNKSE